MSAGKGPDFLVIGAQKCGTTTLYEDLQSHPAIHLADKESSGLLEPDLLTHRGRLKYLSQFMNVLEGHVAGESTTQYAMLPDIDAVNMAGQVLDTAKIVYIVRDPIHRVISHHRHEVALGGIDENIDEAVHTHPSMVHFSRYATQLKGWLDIFGRENVHVIRFEDYMADRQSGAAAVQRFLGVGGRTINRPEAVFNASDSRRVARGPWRNLRSSKLYHQGIRRILPRPVRRKLTHMVLPAPPPRPRVPSAATLAYLAQELRPEVCELAELLKTSLWWDIDGMLAAERVGSTRSAFKGKAGDG